MWNEDKNGVKTPVCFSEPSAYCCGSYFPYESKLSTESPPHISSGANATQKNILAINRDKPLAYTELCVLTINRDKPLAYIELCVQAINRDKLYG